MLDRVVGRLWSYTLFPENRQENWAILNNENRGGTKKRGDYLLDALCASSVGGGVNAEGVLQIPAQGNALGNEGPLVNETLKEFVNSLGHVMFTHNPFRVGTNPCGATPG